MKRRWMWVGLIAIALGFLGAAVKWHSLLGKVYWYLFPKPLVGEIKAQKAQGVNGVRFADAKPDEFSFFAVGHLYGTIQGDDRQPDQALLSAIPTINSLQPNFFVSLGDMVMHQGVDDFTLLNQTLLERFAFPVFNTVGNHDVLDRGYYEATYGQTYSTFDYGPARLVFLDTELKECDLSAPQVDMLKGAVQHALRDTNTRYLFIFMHKTLFFQNDILATLKGRLTSPNGWKCYGQGSFRNLMEDVLIPASLQKPVYLFAGDVGAWGNLTPYYESYPDTSLTMIMTGLGDTSQDNMIYVRVDDTQVNIQVIFLNDLTPRSIADFTPAYWEQVANGSIPLSP